MLDRVLDTNMTLQYQYCNSSNGAFMTHVGSCMDCLSKVPSSKVLVNCTREPSSPLRLSILTMLIDLHALQEACQQRPTIGGHTPVRLSFDLYNTESNPPISSTTAITTSPANTSTAVITRVSSTAASLASSAGVSVDSASHTDVAAMKLGVGIGLGLGLPIVFIGIILSCCYRRQQIIKDTAHEEELRETWQKGYHEGSRNKQRVQQTHPAELRAGEVVPEKDNDRPTVPEKDSSAEFSEKHPARMRKKDSRVELSANR